MKPKSYRRKASRRTLRKPVLEFIAPDPVATEVVENVRAELPQLLAVAVVDVESGACLAAHSNSPAIDPSTAAAYNAEVVRQKQKAMAALALADEHIEDILVTLSSQLHLLQLTATGDRLIYLVVKAQDTSLALAREVLRGQVGQLELVAG